MTRLRLIAVFAFLAAPARATTYMLSVSTAGPASAWSVVTSTPSGIVCPGSACTASFSSGTIVTLGEATSSTMAFAGWSSDDANADDCNTNSPSCAVIVTAEASTVTAHFDPTLAISFSGNGLGVVVSSAAGVVLSTSEYGSGHTLVLPAGTTVVLTESTGTASAFLGWTGDSGCGTASTCTVTLNGFESIVATFTASATSYPLAVVVPNGGGVVRSSPAGISCDGTSVGGCSSSFAAGATVSLSTAAYRGFYFAGWANGGCSGMTACVVTSSSPLQGLGGAQSPAAFFYPISGGTP